ncbi:NfeD family protein [Petroclostridium xylanilyticum]|jgi:membrane protein implicated in regulation of membrane protease activity|uniref:NfeD family protein n=1 Tax=Petroclostridium xylanilyticum TaxID=1792311 RepID=UPI000B9982B5|nr:NfeD family protein [Petroclostridium xylanilyticum]
MMGNIFFIAFAVGVVYTLISFLLGQILSFDGGDIDVDLDWEGIGFFDIPISPLKPVIIASFITIFGGVGLLAHRYNGMTFLLSFCLALTMALIGAFLIYKLIVIPLYRAQNTSAHDINHLQGTDAVVTSSIYGDKFGRIRYVVNDCTYSAPARSINQQDIRQGEKVIIIDVEKNVFYVEKLHE